MEVLGGDDTTAKRRPLGDQAPTRSAYVDLDLPDPDEQDPDRPPPGRDPVIGVVRRALDAVLSAEALGTAGLVVALLTLLAPPMLRLQMLLLTMSMTSPREQMSLLASAISAGAGVTLVLGIAALLRLRSDPSTLARAVAGAATVLGVLLIAVAAWFQAQVDTLPTSF
jgi:hypothetical protein